MDLAISYSTRIFDQMVIPLLYYRKQIYRRWQDYYPIPEIDNPLIIDSLVVRYLISVSLLFLDGFS